MRIGKGVAGLIFLSLRGFSRIAFVTYGVLLFLGGSRLSFRLFGLATG
ncbi:MAG: hypothetical protein ACREO5_05485 [Candidatus Binatia bacterium]